MGLLVVVVVVVAVSTGFFGGARLVVGVGVWEGARALA